MMLAAGCYIVLGQLNLVPTVEVIDGADMFAVGADDFHMRLNV